MSYDRNKNIILRLQKLKFMPLIILKIKFRNFLSLIILSLKEVKLQVFEVFY